VFFDLFLFLRVYNILFLNGLNDIICPYMCVCMYVCVCVYVCVIVRVVCVVSWH